MQCNLAVIKGDGIGPEVVTVEPVGLAGQRFGQLAL